MNRRLFSVSILLGMSLLATTVFAQAPHDVGVFFNPVGTQTTAIAVPFVPFNMWIVGFDLNGEVKGFEFQLTVPAEATVLTRTLPGGGTAINVGSGDNFIVGTGQCLDGMGAFSLVEYQLGFFIPAVPDDQIVCILPAIPSSFVPATPGYLRCDPDGQLVRFGVAVPSSGNYPGGCGVINPVSEPPVATSSDSFGGVKARF